MPNRVVLDLDPDTYWTAPDPLHESAHYWQDLDPVHRGMLSSEQIQRYVEQLQMIHPFDEAQLKPASYELTLGPLYQIDGTDRVLSQSEPILEIPPNSIVFVATGERLVLPHYIVGRFDLQIDLIYRGLLLGTGPQVDPGFRGVLSCPLHNISDNPIRIRFGEQFAKIDFEKTAPWPDAALQLLIERSVATDWQLYELKEQLKHFGVVLFNKSKRWKRPITDYPPGEIKVTSSLARIARSVDRIQVGGVLAMAALLVGAVSLAVGAVNVVANATTAVTNSSNVMTEIRMQGEQVAGQAKDLAAEQQRMSGELLGLRAQVDQIAQDRADLRQQLQRLEERVNATLQPGP